MKRDLVARTGAAGTVALYARAGNVWRLFLGRTPFLKKLDYVEYQTLWVPVLD